MDGFELELGDCDLSELAGATVFGGDPVVEPDQYWEPKTLAGYSAKLRNRQMHRLSPLSALGRRMLPPRTRNPQPTELPPVSGST